MKEKYWSQWQVLCQIHTYTKKYFILAEEYDIDMKTFLQPMKEQKDAYEHLTRAYGKLLLDREESEYVHKNMEKAIGHEYRAFFDSLDFFTISLRRRIRDALTGYTYAQIYSVYPAYAVLKQQLTEMPEKIADFRMRKDVGHTNMLALVRQYADIADSLLQAYKIIQSEILPAFASQGIRPQFDNAAVLQEYLKIADSLLCQYDEITKIIHALRLS